MAKKLYLITWRGKITREVGHEVERSTSAALAKQQFQSRYPLREIVSVSEEK